MLAKHYAITAALVGALLAAANAASAEGGNIPNTDEECEKDENCVIVRPKKGSGGPAGQLTFYIPTKYSSKTYSRFVDFNKPMAESTGSRAQAIACRDALDAFAYHAVFVWEATGGPSGETLPCDQGCQSSTAVRDKVTRKIPEACKDVLPSAEEVADQINSGMGLPSG